MYLILGHDQSYLHIIAILHTKATYISLQFYRVGYWTPLLLPGGPGYCLLDQQRNILEPVRGVGMPMEWEFTWGSTIIV